MRDGVIVHRETQTFPRRSAAAEWARRREVDLADPATLAQARGDAQALTFGDLVDWYVREYEPLNRWGRTKGQDLRMLRNQPIAGVDVRALCTSLWVDHIRARRLAGAGAATALNDLVWAGVVLRAARSARGVDVSPAMIDEARTACRNLRLTGKARRRARRVSEDELARLLAFFDRGDGRAQIPMGDVVRFAVASARRQDEICRLRWDDLDAQALTGIVRDAKHPRHKHGNHRVFKFSAEGWAIVQRQPRGGDLIFPFRAPSISARFTRACKILGIEDLRFHDLRHEAVSRLFEAGYSIPEVAMFSLHDSWAELKRYANLRPQDVRLR